MADDHSEKKDLGGRKIGTILVALVVSPLVLMTFLIAMLAMNITRSSNAALERDSAPEYRTELMDLAQGKRSGTARNDGQLAGTMVVIVFGMTLLVSRSLRRRVANLEAAAERLAGGDLQRPVLVDGADELGLLAHAMDRMRRDLQANAELTARKVEAERDMALTADLQARFLPSNAHRHNGPLSIAAHYSPAEQCGGDWWWIETCKDGSTLLLLGDVTGHGPGPALITASVSTTLQCVRADGTIEDVPGLLKLMSDTLHEAARDDYRMTMSAMRIDPLQKTVDWWCAGAPPVLLMRESGKVETLHATGKLLGDTEFSVSHVQRSFTPGDRLLAFTDGVNEMVLPNGTEFGYRRTRNLLKEGLEEQDMAAARDAFGRGLQKAQAGTPQEDDITYVLVHFTASDELPEDVPLARVAQS